MKQKPKTKQNIPDHCSNNKGTIFHFLSQFPIISSIVSLIASKQFQKLNFLKITNDITKTEMIEWIHFVYVLF